MKIPFVDLHSQYLSLKEELDNAIASVIENSAYIGFVNNPYVKSFEKHFAEFTGVKHCIGCANGTDAIELALKAIGIQAGDEVIVPAQTWVSTAEAVTACGAQVRFVDTTPHQQLIDPTKIEAAITPKTKAIIAVHLRGLPAELDSILEIAKKHNLHLIEDCAQAHGATYKGQHVGTFGSLGTFSFFPGKTLGAYGDAGGVITNNKEYADTVHRLINHGSLSKGEHLLEGRNSRMDGIQAAVLDVKMKHLHEWIASRRKCAETYNKLLKGTGLILPNDTEKGEHAYHLYVIEGDNRDTIANALKEASYPTGIHYPKALPFLPCYAYMNATEEDFPVSYIEPNKILSLPIFPELANEDIKAICDTIKSGL